MTDLPQLQEALVGAARRRNRRSRARSAVVGLAAVAAVVIVSATTLSGPREREREVAAPTPVPLSATPTARETADRFAVLRGDSNLVKDVRGLDAPYGARIYLWLRRNGYSHYVIVDRESFRFVSGRGGKYYGGGIGPDMFRDYAKGRRIGFDKTPAGDAWLYAALVPDGVRDAFFTYRDGTTESVPITGNVLALVSDRQPVKVSWTTPDGEPFTSRVGF